MSILGIIVIYQLSKYVGFAFWLVEKSSRGSPKIVLFFPSEKHENRK